MGYSVYGRGKVAIGKTNGVYVVRAALFDRTPCCYRTHISDLQPPGPTTTKGVDCCAASYGDVVPVYIRVFIVHIAADRAC